LTTAVLVSGGVDSSVALALLREQGQTGLHAYYLKIWLEDELSFLGECPWEEDLKFVRSVCEQLNVPLEVVPLQGDYQERVVEYTLAELRAGRTPSPDIFCNQRIKFGAFHQLINNRHEFIASGHYARVDHRGKHSVLLRGVDPVKDQTYFLSHLSQAQLSRCLFPIGALKKSEVREVAQRYQLATMQRPDSQGICFLGKIKYSEFIAFHLGRRPGKIVDMVSGRVLGGHQGYWFHTIGQRKGLGLSGGPWFVVGKDTTDNIVFVAHAGVEDQFAQDEFELGFPNWLGPDPLPGEYQFKLRHGARTVPGALSFDSQAGWRVRLNAKDRGMAPGQFAVIYQGETCLGGGMIIPTQVMKRRHAAELREQRADV
jgi:tRNA-specific 2-thiouridylase